MVHSSRHKVPIIRPHFIYHSYSIMPRFIIRLLVVQFLRMRQREARRAWIIIYVLRRGIFHSRGYFEAESILRRRGWLAFRLCSSLFRSLNLILFIRIPEWEQLVLHIRQLICLLWIWVSSIMSSASCKVHTIGCLGISKMSLAQFRWTTAMSWANQWIHILRVLFLFLFLFDFLALLLEVDLIELVVSMSIFHQ